MITADTILIAFQKRTKIRMGAMSGAEFKRLLNELAKRHMKSYHM